VTRSRDELAVTACILKESLKEEKCKTENLNKQLQQVQLENTAQSDFVNALKDIPAAVSNELRKKNGVFDQLLESSNEFNSRQVSNSYEIHTTNPHRYDKVVTLLTDTHDLTKKLSPTLTKAFKDFITR